MNDNYQEKVRDLYLNGVAKVQNPFDNDYLSKLINAKTRNAKRCAEERRPNNRSISNTSKKTIRSRFSCSLGCA